MTERTTRWPHRWIDAALDVLFPPACLGCRSLGIEPFCHRCAQTLEPAPKLALPGLHRSVAVWSYGGAIAHAIQRFKYHGRVEDARPLGAAVQACVSTIAFDVVVPMPLTSARLRRRGFNQARELTRSFDKPVAVHAVRRIFDTPSQVGQRKDQRRALIDDAFVADAASVTDRRVLLVDDVVTTGATARAAAGALHRAGAKWVALATIAAAPLQLD